MRLTKESLQINPSATEQRISRFVKDYTRKVGAEGVVLGVSGGLDSATTAALCSRSLGAKKVQALFMPERETYTETDEEHARLLAEKFGFLMKKVDITDSLHALYKAIPDYESKDILSRGNLKARIRMLIWYYYANHKRLIAVGSSDKSEAMLGYFTKWGDASADIAPIMDLYKTQVSQLALHLEIPLEIIKKSPTPALWPGQTAESELGLKYEVLDLILYGFEHFMDCQTIADQLDLTTQTVEGVKKRWLQTEHKRQMPLTTKLEYRTVTHDFRLSRTT